MRAEVGVRVPVIGWLLAAAALGGGLGATPGASAATPGTFAGNVGAKVPAGATARLRAIDRATGTDVRAAHVARSGAFQLKLPAGTYLVVATTISRTGRVTTSQVGVSLKAGQRRVGSTLVRRKNRRVVRRVTANAHHTMWRQERGQVTPGVAVEIPNLTGRSTDPEWNAVRSGLNDMLTTDVVQGVEQCADQATGNPNVVVVETDRRADVLRELEFQQSRYVDPATRVQRNFIIADVEVRGVTADVPGLAGAGDVTLTIVSKSTGEVLGTRTQRVNANSFFEDMETLGKALASDLCKLTDVYEVTLTNQGTGDFATHVATAGLASTLSARRGTGAEAAVWRGNTSTQWQNVTFSSKTGCAYLSPVTATVDWSVEIHRSPPDSITVTWQQDNVGLGPTASVQCPGDPVPPPIPGQPGPSLVGAFPLVFTVPASGGSVPLPNGVTSPDGGFFNSGSIRVTPLGVAKRR